MLQPKDTDWLNGYKNKTHIYAVCKTHFRSQDTCRLKERIEKYFICKCKAKESWNSSPHRPNKP